ncbi:MAG: fatty acid desaturase [Gammaproteobacteria bacterium]|nr:fatty acid desaturase [Gammaproteobacteria bacterium]
METIIRWFDRGHGMNRRDDSKDWWGIAPFIGLHLACAAVFWVGFSTLALWVAIASYVLRTFAISAFFHRGLAHRAFRSGRVTQFVFAFVATTATQRGPLWWVAHHRRHHAYADTSRDPHAAARGLWWSHMGWFLCRSAFDTRLERVSDLARYPELRWLNRFDLLPPVIYGLGLFGLGESLAAADFDTTGWQLLVWGYVLPTVALLHATCLVNSIGHRWGARSFATRDGSRNNLLLALLTLGEGWHNNHHRYAGSARLGLYWWQFDPTYLVLRAMRRLGLVHDLKTARPAAVDPAPTPCA